MQIIVKEHYIELFDEKVINENEQNIQEIIFNFSNEYKDFSKYFLITDLNNKTVKYVIESNNRITMPSFEAKGTYLLGVYAEKIVDNKLFRLNPKPIKKEIEEGSLREAENHQEITPSEFEQYMQILHDSLEEVDTRLKEVEETSKKVENIGVEAEKQGTYAKEQGDYAKKTTDDIKTDVSEGKFDGKSIEFIWQGTKLGIRIQGDTEYSFVDLQGIQGATGPQGEAFSIKKTYSSKEAMDQDFDNMSVGDYVMIASNVNEEDNAKLYTKTETDNKWVFIADFSGAIGIQGPVGKTPKLKIGTVITLDPDEDATANITGTDEDPVLNIGIPKGDKPVRGVDYFTEYDKQDMVNSITEDANSVFNQNVDEKTKEFDNHVTEKTNEFDTNVDSLEEDIDNLYNNQILGTAEGIFIHLEDSADAKLKNVEIEGNMLQKTTNGNTMENTQNYAIEFGGITMTSEKENTFSINGTPTESINKQYPEMIGKDYYLSAGEYYLHYEYISGEIVSEYTGNILTVNIRGTGETTKNYISHSINNYKVNKKVKVVLPEDSIINRVQFLIGTSVNEYKDFKFREWWSKSEDDYYEEYTGGESSPNPNFPQNVDVIKNNIELRISDNKNEEESCSINLQDNFLANIDNVKDSLMIKNDNVILSKFIKKVVHGENSFIECEHGSGTFQFKFLAQSGTHAIRLEYGNQYSKTKCNYASHWKNQWNDNGCFISYQGYPYLLVKENEFGFNENMTIDEAIANLKTLLSKTPIEFYYQMKDSLDNNHSEIINLNETKLPKTYKNISNVSLITNLETNMKIDYVKDTETVVNNLQKQIDDLSKVIIGEENIIVEEPTEESNEITESLENMIETVEGE